MAVTRRDMSNADDVRLLMSISLCKRGRRISFSIFVVHSIGRHSIFAAALFLKYSKKKKEDRRCIKKDAAAAAPFKT